MMAETVETSELYGIAMQVILHAGNARDLTMQVMDKLALAEIPYNEIADLLKHARQELTIAHNKQTDMLQREANGDRVPYSVLFMHAQDTIMTVQSELLIIEKLIPIIRQGRKA